MEPLIAMLSQGEFTSGQRLCEQLGMTRAAVWKRMEKLREEGYAVVSAGKRGYKLETKPDCLLPGYVARGVPTHWAGQGEIRYAPQMDSTNTVLKIMAAAGAPKGSLAVCEFQRQGKGRLGRGWEAAEGENLLHSLLLKPKLPTERAQLCTLAAAVAMAEAMEDTVPGLLVHIKWPNDLMIGGRKCAGILSEISADMDGIAFLVMGIGVNVNQQAFPGELAARATSLRLELERLGKSKPRQEGEGSPIDRCALLRDYLARVEQAMDALEQQGLAGILAEYQRRSITLGAIVRVMGTGESFSGRAESLDETGALWVKDEQGNSRRVLAGDVSVRGVMGYVETEV